MTYSVFMSVYKKDTPDYLKLALDSIYENQIRKPDEVVVVFDGPLTDGLYEVLNEFRADKEEVVKYYPQEVNRGLGEALRIGAEKCTGDYILRMDSDDISVPERFEKQIRYIETHPEIDVLGSCIAEFDQSPVEEHKRIRKVYEKHADIVKMGKKRNPMNHMTVCIKKSALMKSGSYETVLLLEDYYLWMKMATKGCRFANLDEVLVNVRIGNGFNQRRSSKVQIQGWKKLQKLLLEGKIINRFEVIRNMLYIYGFVYCPVSLKKFVYDKLLRKKSGLI